MNKYSRLITLAGGVLSLFSFALPWADDHTGVQMANDDTLNNDVGFVIIIFIASCVIIMANLLIAGHSPLATNFYKILISISSIIGLVNFIVLFFAGRSDRVFLGRVIDDVHYGPFLSAFGFILAIIGALNYLKNEKD